MSGEEGGFTNAEVAGIADEYFLNGRCACPADGTLLVFEEGAYAGRRTIDLFVRCPRCGRTGEHEGTEPDPEVEPWDWDPDDRAVIVDGYWRTGLVRCPLDRSLLRVQRLSEIGRETAETPISVRCRRCGRGFISDEVQIGELPRDTFDGRFAAVQPLAEGGMGKVSLVRERSTGTLYVAKEIKPQRANTEGLERFRREIRLLEKLAHPNVVRLVADFFASGRALFVMEHLPGGHLETLINDRQVPADRLVGLFDQAVTGVEHLHKNGIVHRDLKPKNILLGADERARVSDLGLAHQADATTLTRSGVIMGTPHYMAPEQKTGGSITARTDVFALGLIAYEIATRKSPYVTLKIQSGRFWDVLEQALEEQPERRTATPRGLVEALRAFVASPASPETFVGSGLPTETIHRDVEQAQLGAVPIGDGLDAHLARLGYRRTGVRKRPSKGELYLGRGDGQQRGIYRKEKEPPPGGYSAADVFELLERLA
jgi:hypothetical protein